MTGFHGLSPSPADDAIAPPPRGRGNTPRVAGLVLAAGSSQRMGRCKLLLPWPAPPDSPEPAEALIVPVLRAAREAGLVPLLAVLRTEEASGETGELRRVIREQWKDQGLLVEAPLAHLGQAESLKAGIRALLAREADGEPACAGVLVLLGDQPLLRTPLLERLLAAFAEDVARAVAPSSGGRRGNPVLLPRAAFPDLLSLSGDTGARGLLERHGLRLVSADDTAALDDVDTFGDYERLRKTN